MCSVNRFWRQFAKRSRDSLHRNFIELAYLLPGDQFGQPRSASDRCRAPSAQKTRRNDSSLLDTHGHAQNVTANRVTHVDESGRAPKLAGIPRILKMIENFLRKHASSMKLAIAPSKRPTSLQRAPADISFPWTRRPHNSDQPSQ